jgi:hypothetical protein
MEQSSFLKLVASYFKDTMRLFRFSLESLKEGSIKLPFLVLTKKRS